MITKPPLRYVLWHRYIPGAPDVELSCGHRKAMSWFERARNFETFCRACGRANLRARAASETAAVAAARARHSGDHVSTVVVTNAPADKDP